MTKLSVFTPYKPLWWWTIEKTPPYRYYCFEGGRSSGKSTSVAQSLVMRAEYQPITVLCTREFQNSIADSVHRLLANQIHKLQLDEDFTVTRDDITNINGSRFIFRGLHDNLQSIKSMEGINVCWVEEAQTISDESLDILIPTIRMPGSTIIFTWNPLTPQDPVWLRFIATRNEKLRTETLHAHVTYRDVYPLLNDSIREMITTDKGTPRYQHVWEGKPLEKTVNAIIAFQDLQNAISRKPDTTGMTTLGVDVARFGHDRTAVTIKTGHTIQNIVYWEHESITSTAQRVETIAAQHHATSINVDDTGVGGGLTDILRKHRYPVNPINYAQKANRPDLYPNAASELWFGFAEQLPHLSINPDIESLPDLTQELTTRSWHINNRGQRQVESKKDYTLENETRSPDLADSLLLSCYQPPQQPDWDITV